jgi:hypothetical protein
MNKYRFENAAPLIQARQGASLQYYVQKRFLFVFWITVEAFYEDEEFKAIKECLRLEKEWEIKKQIKKLKNIYWKLYTPRETKLKQKSYIFKTKKELNRFVKNNVDNGLNNGEIMLLHEDKVLHSWEIKTEWENYKYILKF